MGKVVLVCNGFDKCDHPTCPHKTIHTPHPHHDLGSCVHTGVEHWCVPVEQLADQLPEVQ